MTPLHAAGHGALAVLVLGFGGLCAAFVRQDGLGTFADDSVSYLVMAQVFSPWREASAPVAAAFATEAFQPPLFPLVLALVGAAHDFAAAHVLNAVFAATAIFLTWALGVRWLGGRATALLAASAVALLPGVWVETRGILSEPLFCVLLLGSLWLTQPALPERLRTGLLAIAFSLLCLTRTAGVPVVLAYAVWMASRKATLRERLVALLPAAAGLAAYAAWLLLRPADVMDINSLAALDRLRELAQADAPLSVLAAGVWRQALAMQEAWIGALMLFWVEGQAARPFLAALVGVLALAGLAMRFRDGRPDAWMAAAYLLLYLVWPFYDQMTRFLFPLLPVLMLYAFLSARGIAGLARRQEVGAVVALLLVISLAAPGLAFLQQRHAASGPQRDIADWYRTPDLSAAHARARTHLGLAADMEAVRAHSAPGERVMWVAPAYIALLADRHGVAAPAARSPLAEYRTKVASADPHLVLLTRYHPRDTIRDEAWRAGIAALGGQGTLVYSRAGRDGPDSLLLRLKP